MKRFIFLVLALSALIFHAQDFDSIRIFLFDGDLGKTFINPDNSQQSIGYEYNFEKAFNTLGFNTSTGNLVKSIYLPSSLGAYMQYGAVFIVMGNGDPSKITTTDIQNFKSYLDSGGCLFIEGNNVASYLYAKDSLLMINYFNNSVLSNGGTGYSYYDTLISDTTDTTDPFYRLYKFIYPAGTGPDSSVDVLGPKTIFLKLNYKSMLNYNDQSKLYVSTTSAYTPPDTKTFTFNGKTIMQTVAFGAFADPHVIPNTLPDSLDNQLVRLSYLKDILAFFGIGKTLLVKDDRNALNTDDTIRAALDDLGIEYTKINVLPDANGPSYSEIMKYTYVIWFTGGVDSLSTLTNTDTTNLAVYLSYGGNFILSGENIAQDLGELGIQTNIFAENPFMALRLRVDYLSSDVDKNVYYAHPNALFYGHSAAKTCSLYTLTMNSKVDYIRPYLRGDHVDSAYYFITTGKADNLVAISNQGIMQRSLFFGFCIEKLFKSDITSILSTSYYQYFTMPFDFHPLYTSKKEDSNLPFVKQKEISAKAEYLDGFIVLTGIDNPKLIDVSGREVLSLDNGYNNVKGKIKNGVYFIKGKFKNANYFKTLVVL